jgi:hypothetical protein
MPIRFVSTLKLQIAVGCASMSLQNQRVTFLSKSSDETQDAYIDPDLEHWHNRDGRDFYDRSAARGKGREEAWGSLFPAIQKLIGISVSQFSRAFRMYKQGC